MKRNGLLPATSDEARPGDVNGAWEAALCVAMPDSATFEGSRLEGTREERGLSRQNGGERRRRLAQLRGKAAPTGGNRARFDQLVVEALREIPAPFRSRLENVAIVAEEEPSRELLESLGMDPTETLLGLYDGVPLTERGDWYNLIPPDRIILFRRPILGLCQTAEEVREEVRRTVLHEVAHFYGIDDAELTAMGLD